MENKIKMKSVDREVFDKKQIALAIKNSTYEDELSCSLRKEGICSCNNCSLKSICEGIDRVAEEYVERTTEVVSSFDVR